jgi:hypothetical protein
LRIRLATVKSDDTRALEVLRLVDQLDALIHEAKVVPLTRGKVSDTLKVSDTS